MYVLLILSMGNKYAEIIILGFFQAKFQTVNSVNKTRLSKAAMPEDNSILFSREKEELFQAGFEPTMFCVLGRRPTN